MNPMVFTILAVERNLEAQQQAVVSRRQAEDRQRERKPARAPTQKDNCAQASCAAAQG